MMWGNRLTVAIATMILGLRLVAGGIRGVILHAFYAAAKTLLKEYKHLSVDGIGVILLGTGVSFVVALVVVAGFLTYVRTRRFTPFAVYRVVLGLVVLAWYFGANRGTGL